MARPPNVGWLQHWAVGCNHPCNARSSVGLSGSLSGCLAQLSSVASNRPSSVRTANKQGKIAAFIALKVDDSLWRRDGSVWRFRPRKSRLGSLYLCTRATGRIARLHAAVGIGSPAIRLRTDFYVRRNIARCVSSNSILFGLLPKTLAMAFVFLPRQSTNFVLLCTRFVENFALAGGGAVPPKSDSPDLESAVGKGVVAYVAQPLNPHKYER